MHSFLSQVAEDMLDRIPSGEIAGTVVVLPSQRASVYLSRELARLSRGPLFAPRYMSLQELSCRMTGLRKADQIELTCLLYDTYRSVLEETGTSAEEIDEFLPWAEMMLRDFSQIDQYGVNAGALFLNLSELHAWDALDYLSQDQVEALQNFFDDFTADRMTSLKDAYRKVWNHLGSIYMRFRDLLLEKGIGYSGLITRQAANSEVLPEGIRHIVFAGHGALSQSEIRLMKKLKEHLDCLFYWDIDPRLLENGHEAGYFMRHNIQELGSALDGKEKTVSSPKIRLVSVAGSLFQGRLATSWLKDAQEKEYIKRECAVILPDERLLPTILHSIPDEVKEVNITMGYPLSHTLPHSFLSLLLSVQLNRLLDAPSGNQDQKLRELGRHPLFPYAGTLTDPSQIRRLHDSGTQGTADHLEGALCPIKDNALFVFHLRMLIENMMGEIRRLKKENDWMDADLNLESLWRCHKALDRLENLMASGALKVGTVTLLRLLGRLITQESIPFHSEMDQGYQIMGVLESRAMDFSHILLLSMNEDSMPKGKGSQASYIPQSLRRAFGLPSQRELSALYAYTFYRLLRRASTVTLAYNAAVSGIEGGQMSRYLLQILLDGGYDVTREHLAIGGDPLRAMPLSIKKTPWMQEKLLMKYVRDNVKMSYLSPSALNCYLDCKLKFCLNYIYGLRKDDEPLTDVDAALFGTIFHKAAENLYTLLTKNTKDLGKQDLERVTPLLLNQCVEDAIRSELLDKPEGALLASSGIIQLIRQVIIRQVGQTIRMDLNGPGLSVTGMEKEVREAFRVPTEDGDILVRVGGFIDHEDISEGTLRITDYKTGGEDQKPKSIEELFSREAPKRAYRDFQILTYCLLEKRKGFEGRIRPQMLYVKQLNDKNYWPSVLLDGKVMEDFTPHAQEMEKGLISLLEEIFSPMDTYEPCKDDHHCQLCDFQKICALRRNEPQETT